MNKTPNKFLVQTFQQVLNFHTVNFYKVKLSMHYSNIVFDVNLFVLHSVEKQDICSNRSLTWQNLRENSFQSDLL